VNHVDFATAPISTRRRESEGQRMETIGDGIADLW
jgi:hypothetical protein